MTNPSPAPTTPVVRIDDAHELRAIICEMLDMVELFLVEKAGGASVGPQTLNLINLYCGSLKPLVLEEDPNGSGSNGDGLATAGALDPTATRTDGEDLPQS